MSIVPVVLTKDQSSGIWYLGNGQEKEGTDSEKSSGMY